VPDRDPETDDRQRATRWPPAKRDGQPEAEVADNCVPARRRRVKEPRLTEADKLSGIPPPFESRMGDA